MSFCLHKTVLSFIYSRFVVKVLLLPEELVGTVCRKYIFQLWLFHVIVLNKHVVDCTKYYINVMIITLMIEMEVLVLFCLLFFSLFFSPLGITWYFIQLLLGQVLFGMGIFQYLISLPLATLLLKY